MAEQGLRRTGGTELNLESMGVNLPYSMQAEQSVLGAALLQADIIPELVDNLCGSHSAYDDCCTWCNDDYRAGWRAQRGSSAGRLYGNYSG